ncbi:MAG: FAD-dependent oxidoreductase, partial [Planctomycetota bacterium]
MTVPIDKRVAVIGGGIAGLSAAWHLIRCGVSVKLFESRRTTGGRAGSFQDANSGDQIDYCQHVGMGCCTNLLQWFDDMHLPDAFDRTQRLTFIAENGEHCVIDPSKRLPAPFHLATQLGKMRFLSGVQRRRLAWGMWRLMRLRDQDADIDQTMGQWLRFHGQCDGLIRDFWDVVLVSALGESCDQAAIVPARKVFVDGFLGNVDAADVLVPRDSLKTLFGERIAGVLEEQGVQIHTGAAVQRVDRISTSPDTFPEYQLQLADKSLLAFDAVIPATAWYSLPRLFDGGSLGEAQMLDGVLKLVHRFGQHHG